MPKVERSEVDRAIDTELRYQWHKFGKVDNPHEIDAFATYIRRYSTILDEVATGQNTDQEKLDVVRKIAAICVECMLQHGAPRRIFNAILR